MKCEKVNNEFLGDNFLYPEGVTVENSEGRVLGSSAAALIELGLGIFREGMPPGILIDVGANFGLVSKLLIKTGLFKHIDAFECNPNIATILEKNLSNEDVTTNIFNSAVGNTCEIIDFTVPIGNASSFGSHNMFGINTYDHDATGYDMIKINKMTLDSYYKENPGSVSAIKIDVEGFEHEVLQGAKDLIAEQRPIIVYECLEIESHQMTHKQLWEESDKWGDLNWCKLLAGTRNTMNKDKATMFLDDIGYLIQPFPWSKCDLLAVPEELCSQKSAGKA